jgi:hypothetical protein
MGTVISAKKPTARVTVRFLVERVDEDFSHWRNNLSWHQIFMLLGLFGLGVAFLLLANEFAQEKPVSIGIFGTGIAIVAIAFSFFYGSSAIYEREVTKARFQRILKSLASQGLDSPRNKLILWSLIMIAEAPDAFREETLIRYAVKER